jgi:hypothetical protein
VDVAPEVDPAKPPERVHRSEPEAKPPAFAGDRDRDSVGGVFAALSHEALSVRVAADDTVHDDDVCTRNEGRLRYDVADPPGDLSF